MNAVDISDKTHTYVPLASVFDAVNDSYTISDGVIDNVKLLKDYKSNARVLCVVSDYSTSTDFYDLLNVLKRKGLSFQTKYCSREELKKISDSVNANEILDGNSEIQEQVLEMCINAIERRASDVHILVSDAFTNVSFRTDSIVSRIIQYEKTSKSGQRLVQATFNSMCEQREPANFSYETCCYARFKPEFSARLGLNSVRVTTRPAGGGVTKMVMRLVPRKKDEISSLAAAGLTPEEQKILRRVTAKPAGAIITSGPMGHGKSTISQLLAEEIARKQPGKHLVSVEDPVESPIPGWYQTPLLDDWPQTIANLMRMDCNGLYLGEVRTEDSANGVISASQTGNIVLTTIHTDHPIDIIQRLRKLGVEEDLLTDATIITCLIGLRLTPLLCDSCKIPYIGNENIVDDDDREIIINHTNVDKVYLHNPKGCEKCSGTGFRGRTGVFEIIETNYKFMRLYMTKGKFEAWSYWKSNGGITLCDNMKRLIHEGRVDPIKAHQSICNLDRDEKFYERD